MATALPMASGGGTSLRGILVVVIEQAECVQQRWVTPKNSGLLRCFQPQQQICRHRCLTAAGVIPKKRPHAAEHAFEVNSQSMLSLANLRNCLRYFFPADRGDVAANETLQFGHHGVAFVRIRPVLAPDGACIVVVGAC
jgi:hypothetical protein